MTAPPFTLRHLTFTGLRKPTATIDFGPGLNVVYGASDTGKSLILETIDFVLGSGEKLREIPERIGYDRIFLGVTINDGSTLTFERATAGGKIKVHQGLHKDLPKNATPIELSAKHSAHNDRNISMFLLGKMGIAGARIRKNQKGEANSLSFRNLSHLAFVPIGDIQKNGSPIESGKPISRTAELSVFKLLLTGVDDSATESKTISPDEKLSREAKIEVIDELIDNYRSRIESLVGDGVDDYSLTTELGQIDSDLEQAKNALSQTEQEFQIRLAKRNELRSSLQDATDRQQEIKELLARFALLDAHYESDLTRLTALREAGALVGALTLSNCPLCGAPPDAQHMNGMCDGNVDVVVQATDAETNKIHQLRSELVQTVATLQTEARLFDAERPRIEGEIDGCNADIANLSPALNEQRDAFVAHLERRSSVKSALDYTSSISELEGRKSGLATRDIDAPETEDIVTELPTYTLDEFSEHLENTLKAWHFPEPDRVHFDRTMRDFNIGGKPRGSRGTGMRAITHAAFTVSLMEYTLANSLVHPGFVVMDTPLLAYREPEGDDVPSTEVDDDDLTDTDVKECFYRHLASTLVGQAIILESSDPPDDIKAREQTTFFTKSRSHGRYGFFPTD